jgi:cyclic pyranopterin phosphate synthase
MPEREYVWLPRADILQFEEVDRLVDVFAAAGVNKVRLTGGEPLLRHNLPALIARIAAKPAIRDLAMTTNGVLLAPLAQDLKKAGLGRLTISLDTLHASRFRELTRMDDLDRVLEGISTAAPIFPGLKIDTVIIRGINDDELGPILEYGRSLGAEVRFIEYMDVGGATLWSMDRVVSRRDMLDRLTALYGPVTPIDKVVTSAPADQYRLRDGTTFGIIASTTEPFCRDCDRSRLTADGMWYLCLYATQGLDLRAPLRANASVPVLKQLIEQTWAVRTDRGAETRLASRERGLISVDALRRDPHLEMHTRGG